MHRVVEFKQRKVYSKSTSVVDVQYYLKMGAHICSVTTLHAEVFCLRRDCAASSFAGISNGEAPKMSNALSKSINRYKSHKTNDTIPSFKAQ